MNKTNAMQVFNFERAQVRVVEKDGEPWFVAKDICEILEHSNSRMAVEVLENDEKGVSKVYTLGGEQEMTVISESGLYALILRSNKPEAKKFRKWVTSEVLPAIRKTASYVTPETREKLDAELRRADAMLNNSRVRMAKFIRETVKEIWDYLSPEAKQAYSSHVVDTVSGQPGLIPLPVIERSYTATELAAEFGVSANKIGRIANANGLKRAEFGFEVLDKAVGHDKQVVSFRYNNKGKDAIRTLLQAGRA